MREHRAFLPGRIAFFSKLILNLEIKRYVIPYFYLYLHGEKYVIVQVDFNNIRQPINKDNGDFK